MYWWANEYERLYGEPAPVFGESQALGFNLRLKAEIDKAAPDGRITAAEMAACARKAEGKPA